MSTTIDGQRSVATSPSAEEFAQRLLDAILGAQFVQAAYLGERLGYYRTLAAAGPLTSPELADRTGTAERYAREWLEHQAVAGVLTVDDPAAAPDDRRFELPAGPKGKGTLQFTQCWGISADSKAQAQAVDLVKSLSTVEQQMAFADAFVLLTAMFLATAFMVFLLKKPAPPKPGAAGGGGH